MSNDLIFCCRLYKSAAELARQKTYDHLMKAELLLNPNSLEPLSVRKLKAAFKVEKWMKNNIA
nr:MAG TPA: hypothetical protein [Caudoviricetes sp.]